VSVVVDCVRRQEFAKLSQVLLSEGKIANYRQFPIDIDQLLVRFGLKVIRHSIIADGYLDNTPEGPVIHLRKDLDSHLSRFTLAHELGHWLLNTSLARHNEQLVGPLARERVERACDHFASTLLVPRSVISRYFKSGTELFRGIEALARDAVVPLRAPVIRLHHSTVLDRLEKAILILRPSSLPWKISRTELRVWESACPSWGHIPCYRSASTYGLVNILRGLPEVKRRSPEVLLEPVRVRERKRLRARGKPNSAASLLWDKGRARSWVWRDLGPTEVTYRRYLTGNKGFSLIAIFDWARN
jgi:Zn-dependent peptidase ImmA (M78 family)